MFPGQLVVVTGGRDYTNAQHIYYYLDMLDRDFEELSIVQGGARGVDSIARAWALRKGVPCFTLDAPWDFLGKKAGNIRNGWMLRICIPNFVLAFPGGSGTADCIKQAEQLIIRVYRV